MTFHFGFHEKARRLFLYSPAEVAQSLQACSSNLMPNLNMSEEDSVIVEKNSVFYS